MDIIIKGESFNHVFFKGKPLNVVKASLIGKYPENTIVKVWKLANGLSVPTKPQTDERKQSPPTDEDSESE